MGFCCHESLLLSLMGYFEVSCRRSIRCASPFSPFDLSKCHAMVDVGPIPMNNVYGKRRLDSRPVLTNENKRLISRSGVV